MKLFYGVPAPHPAKEDSFIRRKLRELDKKNGLPHNGCVREESPSPAYGARLEIVLALIASRGFESLFLRSNITLLRGIRTREGVRREENMP